jgi:hypothetical protein
VLKVGLVVEGLSLEIRHHTPHSQVLAWHRESGYA